MKEYTKAEIVELDNNELLDAYDLAVFESRNEFNLRAVMVIAELEAGNLRDEILRRLDAGGARK